MVLWRRRISCWNGRHYFKETLNVRLKHMFFIGEVLEEISLEICNISPHLMRFEFFFQPSPLRIRLLSTRYLSKNGINAIKDTHISLHYSHGFISGHFCAGFVKMPCSYEVEIQFKYESQSQLLPRTTTYSSLNICKLWGFFRPNKLLTWSKNFSPQDKA